MGVGGRPPRRAGHAGAIISGSKGTAQAKMEAPVTAGLSVVNNPIQAGKKMVEIVKRT